MPLTREQVTEMAEQVKGVINTLFNSEEFLENFATKVSKIVCIKIEQIENRLNNELLAMTNKNKMLEGKIDNLEQYSRKTSLRVFGIQEQPNENPEQLILGLINSKLKLNFDSCKIEACHRIGKKTDKPRAIIVKFESYKFKQLVFANKKYLKGTSYVIREDLTATRNALLKESGNICGRQNTWTKDGVIHAIYKTKRFRITNNDDLLLMESYNGE